MTITTTPTQDRAQERALAPERLVREFRLWLPEPIRRWPEWLRVGGFLLILTAISVYIRTRQIGGQFWMDEAISVGIASHSLSAIPGVLRMDGSPPLYYMLLHIWMSMFGNGEAATHAMSLLFGTLTIPVAYWAGYTLIGKRAGLMASVMFALSPFITEYSQETRMYSLMALLGLLATVGFVHGFVFRRRKYVALFAVSEALMLYTHAWALFFGAGSLLALAVVYRLSDDQARENLIKDAVFAYVGAGVLFLPWLPNFIYQMTHTAAPWDSSPHFGAPVQLSQDLVGGDAITAVLAIAAAVGLSDFFVRRGRHSVQARMMWAFVGIAVLTLAAAWLASQITPAWVPRYFAPILAPIALLACLGLSRAGILGAIAIVLAVVFLHSPTAFAPSYKSDMRDVGFELGTRMNPGDMVIVGQPEQTPLAYYYFPGGLRFANTMAGPVKDPSFMNWVNALERYRRADPWKILPRLLNSLKPGQQVAYIQPLTEGVVNWTSSWTSEIELRSAQWGSIFSQFVREKKLQPEYYAPHNYRGACCVADSAMLYKKL